MLRSALKKHTQQRPREGPVVSGGDWIAVYSRNYSIAHYVRVWQRSGAAWIVYIVIWPIVQAGHRSEWRNLRSPFAGGDKSLNNHGS